MNGAELKLACKAVDIEIIRETSKFIEARRPDGLVVFFDKFDADRPDADILMKLNAVRLYGEPADVIFMVGIVRGLQVAMAYARRQGHAFNPEDYARAIPVVRQISAGAGQKKRQKKLAKEAR